MAATEPLPPLTFLSKETIKRLLKDVKEIIANPLVSHGIHYKHHDTNLLNGHALIIGPRDTPYAGGYYLFEFIFPVNYPHSPPEVIYYTNDGETRFNPNLYKCGKVCLSVLNTWRGDQWTGCQTISSILLSLCTVFNEAPLLNEPGITRSHFDFKKYNDIIHYKNMEVAIVGMPYNFKLNAYFTDLQSIIRADFIENYERNLATIQKNKEGGSRVITTGIYTMAIVIDYDKLEKKIRQVYDKMKNEK